MIYWLATIVSTTIPGLGFFRIAQFISFRSIAAALTALLLAIWLGPRFILFLHRRGLRDVPKGFTVGDAESKKGTPVMGGLLTVIVLLGSALLWCDLSNHFIQVLFVATLFFTWMGARDDIGKIKQGRGEGGLSQVAKLALQGAFGIALGWYIGYSEFSPWPDVFRTEIYLPFVKPAIYGGIDIDLKWFYIPFVVLTMMFISNSVNIADGLDGLAIVPSLVAAGVFSFLAYVIGTRDEAFYLLFRHIIGTTEITVFLAGFVGAGIGFLWFNCYPAQLFMGDTGSLSLGGILATTAILLKQEAMFLFAGAFFVVEGLSSVISQRIGHEWLGRRLISRAPLHHAFQHAGLSEPKVVVRAWILSILAGLLALATLKIR
ncbi:MAG: phospho-N-acetylmuramoyl-pentapeptide-transferase [bacterium]|nr:phospho-N-acetylmuramoyl-pentapeptide-transferase [bacterium]